MSPEVYLSSTQGGKCGGWGLAEEAAKAGDESKIDYAKLKERGVVWAVSIPGQSDWCFREFGTRDLDEPGRYPRIIQT